MIKVQETPTEIVFTEKLPKRVRFFLFCVGWIPILFAPYELLVRPRWNGFSFFMLMAIIISVGAIAVGALFVLLGFLGFNQTLQFHLESKTIHYSYRSVVTRLRRKTFRFDDLLKYELYENDWSDGPSSYSLQFVFYDGQKIRMGSFKKKDEAEEYLHKVEKLLR